jgi:hypothetical protein
MGEKGIDPGAAQPNPGMGMAAMPNFGDAIQAAPSQSAGAPQPAPQPASNPVVDAVETVLDPLGIHKLF